MGIATLTMMASRYRSIQAGPSILRRRMNHASSCTETKLRRDPKTTRSESNNSEEQGEDHSNSSLSDYESYSQSEDGESHEASFRYEQPPAASKRAFDSQDLDPRHHSDHHPEVSQKAWYEFDLAVLVALVSPVGNWLTGGDHVKNLLFIGLLVFYLHQVIEVPWMLYQNARRRRRPPHLPPVNSEDKYRQLAISELRKFEMFFLVMTVLSPFMGAYLLVYATTAVIGPSSFSWFSIGLFVMATGMRPWSHLVDRLSQRTMDLHDFIHYPPTPTSDPTHSSSHESLIKQVTELHDSLAKMESRIKHTTEEVFDYIDDAVDSLDRSMRKNEKKWDKQEGRVRSVEEIVATLSGSSQGERKGVSFLPVLSTKAVQSILEQVLPTWLLTPPVKSRHGPRYSGASYSSKSSPGSVISTPLETIVEEDSGSYPVPAKAQSLAARIIYRMGYVITLPIRAAVRMVFGRY